MSDPKMIKETKKRSLSLWLRFELDILSKLKILEQRRLTMLMRERSSISSWWRFHVDKKEFQVPFVCGAKDLEKPVSYRWREHQWLYKSGSGTGDIVRQSVICVWWPRNCRIKISVKMNSMSQQKNSVPVELVQYVHEHGKLPVVNSLRRWCGNTSRRRCNPRCGRRLCWLRDFRRGVPVKRSC